MNRNLKTILTGVGIFLTAGLLIFIYFQFIAPSNSTPDSTRKVITKAQSKTYLKYVTLNNQEVTPTVTVTISPTVTISELTPTTTIEQSTTPEVSPTEIIVALVPSGSATNEAETTAGPSTIAELPTTGLIQGSIVIFLIAAFMIVFAFVL
jgi:hypothetical protein